MTHMMECYYLEGDGQIETARQALQKFDSLLQDLALHPWDEVKLADNSMDLARLAAWRATMPTPAPNWRPASPGFRRTMTNFLPRRLIAFRPASAG